MKRLNIDLDELSSAMQDNSYDNQYFLNLQTGEILLISPDMNEQEIEHIKGKLAKEKGNYEKIPRIELFQVYQDMEDFIATVNDEQLISLLEMAINQRDAFYLFKSVLVGYPEESKRWSQFKDNRMRQRCLEWLNEIGVEPAKK